MSCQITNDTLYKTIHNITPGLRELVEIKFPESFREYSVIYDLIQYIIKSEIPKDFENREFKMIKICFIGLFKICDIDLLCEGENKWEYDDKPGNIIFYRMPTQSIDKITNEDEETFATLVFLRQELFNWCSGRISDEDTNVSSLYKQAGESYISFIKEFATSHFKYEGNISSANIIKKSYLRLDLLIKAGSKLMNSFERANRVCQKETDLIRCFIGTQYLYLKYFAFHRARDMLSLAQNVKLLTILFEMKLPMEREWRNYFGDTEPSKYDRINIPTESFSGMSIQYERILNKCRTEHEDDYKYYKEIKTLLNDNENYSDSGIGLTPHLNPQIFFNFIIWLLNFAIRRYKYRIIQFNENELNMAINKQECLNSIREYYEKNKSEFAASKEIWSVSFIEEYIKNVIMEKVF